MKLTKKMCSLIAELEYIIGSECYNPNSYDGWQDMAGYDFRYPISMPDNEGNYTKIRSKITNVYLTDSKNIDANLIKYMKYKFGSNELFIGRGLIRVMNYLEEYYNIDFAELERRKK